VYDKEFVDINPVFFWDNLKELLFSFFRCLGFGNADTVAYSVDVDVNWNCWLSKSIDKNAVCCFSSNSWEFHKFIKIFRHLIFVLLFDYLAKFFYVSCLDAIEANAIDEFF